MTKAVRIDLLNDYTILNYHQGSKPGGFFRKNEDGKEYYIKWLTADALDPKYMPQEKPYANRSQNLFNNEFLALQLYKLYGVSVPEAEFITFTNAEGILCYGIASELKKDIRPLNQLAVDSDQFTTIRQKAQEDFLIDALFSNYDVVGQGRDNMHYDTNHLSPFRLDAGGSLKYDAQGKPKKDLFNDEVNEFEEMESGLNTRTGFNLSTLTDASVVFKGIHDSPTLLINLKKLLAVSDEQITECVQTHGFDEETIKVRKKNDALINTLLARKKNLIAKAEEKIFNKMIKDFLQSKPLDSDTTSRQLTWKDDNASSKRDGMRASRIALNTGRVFRLNHGGMHASRVALYTEKFVALLQENGYPQAKKLMPKDLFLIKVAAMFHDTGRQKDSGDDQAQWEADAAEKCAEWLSSAGFDKEDIDKVVEAIANKNNPAIQTKNMYALVLAASASLDWVRSNSSIFNIQYLPKLIQEKIPEDTLMDLAQEAKKLALEQGDSPLEQLGLPGEFNFLKKEEYELHNPQGCYGATRRTYQSLNYLDEKKKILEQKIADARNAVSGEINPDQLKAMVDKAISEKNWRVIQIVHEKAPLITNVAQLLLDAVNNQQWKDVFDIQKAFQKEDYTLTEGPLPKSDYTVQLERLAKDLMDTTAVEFKEDAFGNTIIVVNEVTYNLTDIIKHANFDQVTLDAEHFESYRRWMEDYPAFGGARSNLDLSQEEYYKKQLHSAYTQSGQPMPDPAINFQEMQAINIYSDTFFGKMNALLRDKVVPDSKKKLLKNKNQDQLKAAIIHSVMCASGLQKIPETTIKESYRFEYFVGLPKELFLQYLAAASHQGIVPLAGFISTSIHHDPNHDIHFHFTKMRGVYIAPIASHGSENEFLIPPTQVQFKKYYHRNHKHYFEVSMATDLEKDSEYDLSDPNDFMRVVQAIMCEDKNIITFLTAQKTIDTLQSYYNLTPLMMVVQVGNAKIVNVFMNELQTSAKLMQSINLHDACGNTPLIRAVMQKNLSMAEALIRYGANVNCTNAEAKTPLMLAISESLLDIVQILITALVNQDAIIDLNFPESVIENFTPEARACLEKAKQYLDEMYRDSKREQSSPQGGHTMRLFSATAPKATQEPPLDMDPNKPQPSSKPEH